MASAVPVAFVNHTGVIGGAERSLLGLLEDLDRTRYAPQLWAPASGRLLAEAEARGVAVHRLPVLEADYRHGLPGLARGAAGILATARAAARLVARERPAVLHANSLRAGLVARFASGDRIPVLWHVRDLPPAHPVNRAIGWIGDAPCVHWVANSRAVAHALGALTSKPVRVVHNGIPVDRFAAGVATPWPRVPASAFPVVGIVGQIIPWKGQLGLLEAFAEVARVHPTAQLWVVGAPIFRAESTAYEAALKARARDLGLVDRVVFWGASEDIPGALAGMDIVVLNSNAEPFGRVIIEAQASRKPVVATDAGGVPELVRHGETGWLVPPGDQRLLVDALLALTADAALRTRLGEAGERQVAEMFTQRRMAEALMAVLDEVRGC